MTDQNDIPGLPPRGESFTSEAARAVWAAIVKLPHVDQHMVSGRLMERLAGVGEVLSHEVRARKATVALREVAAILDRSPSVADYRLLRAERPECDWPADSCVRTWLGSGSWNDALRAARLDAVPDGDVFIRALGPAFSADEIIETLHDATDELGFVPTFHQYVHWTRRPDVIVRPGRRPGSQIVFTRVFGGYIAALQAAGLTERSEGNTAHRSSVQRLAAYRINDETIAAAIRMVADRVGHAPRTTEYIRVREELIAEATEAGTPVPLPAHSTIQKHHPIWDDALELAGLPRLGGRATASRGRKRPYTPRGPKYTQAQFEATLREARAAIDGPLTTLAFKRWRQQRLEDEQAAGRLGVIPGYDSYYQHYRSWPRALAAALDEQRAEPDEPFEGSIAA